MATDTESQYISGAYDFPSRMRSRSRRRTASRHRKDASSPIPSSPPSPPVRSPAIDDDASDHDELSPLDPRRFTPTLHASLVSEILSLRREVESKSKVIDDLEQSLHESRIENEDLSEKLSQSTKEVRSVKHQIQLLEGGTSSALTELAKERDQALENIADVRKKLDQAQRKARAHEEDLKATQLIWNQEKEAWEGERKNLERKVHVVESRLKTVLNEVAAAREAGSFNAVSNDYSVDPAKEPAASRESDSASVHSSSQGRQRTSITSLSTDDGYDRHNGRFSVMSAVNGRVVKNNTLNLAQELDFDEENEGRYDSMDDEQAPMSPDALPEERPASVNSQASYALSSKARKILGLSFDGSIDGHVPLASSERVSEQRKRVSIVARALDYRDASVQSSPPVLQPVEFDEKKSVLAFVSTAPSSAVQARPPPMKDSGTLTSVIDMVSASCQTVSPPSPPETESEPESPRADPVRVTMATVSTQTEEVTNADGDAKKPGLTADEPESPQIPIPTIAIHPPGSEPSSPRGSVVLPPQTKSVSCQTLFESIVDLRSVGMQTEEIRIDTRPVKLPPSLLPSAIPDLPLGASSREPPASGFPAPPPKSAQRPAFRSVFEKQTKASRGKSPPMTIQAYPGDNDNGPLSDDSKPGICRPLRSSSLFAGFEQLSDEEVSGVEESDIFTDEELLNRPLTHYTLKRGKLVSRRSVDEKDTLLEIDEPVSDPEIMTNDNGEEPLASFNKAKFGYSKSRRRHDATASGTKDQDIRRTAMISRGAAAHQRMHARSSSDISNDANSAGSSIAPPFPVPVRLSSRKHPRSRDGTQSPTPSKRKNGLDSRKSSIVRRPTVRRTRSATVMSQEQHEYSGSGSSSAVPSSPYAPDSPPYPPLPLDDITVPRSKRAGRRPSYPAPVPPPFGRDRADSATTMVQPTSVVDAIAQTMVGEWMFKYVRRRRSFGVGEARENWDGKAPEDVSASLGGSGVRHKRWVWLAPYERAIIWSSKQPTSGPALLGKSGRKFTIKSVLDVKDDNPLPKGFPPQNQFNRSILILTPQRALKFTAMSFDRHFVWLTALSFLSDPTMGMHELAALPPAPREEFPAPRQAATLRRNPIRDSIRVAKGKTRPAPKGKHSFMSQPEPVPELPADEDDNLDSAMDAADPPFVPRFSNHARKHSRTLGRPPTIRSFSSQATMPSWNNAGSPDAYSPVGPSFHSGQSSLSYRPSEASGASSPVPGQGTGNFFDAIGTVRMEAFIDRTDLIRYHSRAQRRSRHFRKPSNYWNHESRLGSFDLSSHVDSNDIYYRSDGGAH